MGRNDGQDHRRGRMQRPTTHQGIRRAFSLLNDKGSSEATLGCEAGFKLRSPRRIKGARVTYAAGTRPRS